MPIIVPECCDHGGKKNVYCPRYDELLRSESTGLIAYDRSDAEEYARHGISLEMHWTGELTRDGYPYDEYWGPRWLRNLIDETDAHFDPKKEKALIQALPAIVEHLADPVVMAMVAGSGPETLLKFAKGFMR